MRFTLDSNILIYAMDGREPTRREAAIGILAAAARVDCVLTPQALAEYFQVVTRKQIVARADAACQVSRWMELFPVTDGAGSRALRTALQASVTGRFQFYDALLLATAGNAGCEAAISENMGAGAELDGLRIVPAFDHIGGISAAARALLS